MLFRSGEKVTEKKHHDRHAHVDKYDYEQHDNQRVKHAFFLLKINILLLRNDANKNKIKFALQPLIAKSYMKLQYET